MKRLCLSVFILIICLHLSAQVLSTRKDNAGTITKYMRMQFGKDTIQLGVPFKSKDKPGMGISISRTDARNYFTFDLRSPDRELLTDSIDINKTSLIFTMNNNDTVKIKSLAKGHYDYMVDRTKESVMIFIHAYLTERQVDILHKDKIATLHFYIDDNRFIILPITNSEKRRFKNAIGYLLN